MRRSEAARLRLRKRDRRGLDIEALGTLDQSVYFALGGRSNPDYYAPNG
jgi:hypothetical protein